LGSGPRHGEIKRTFRNIAAVVSNDEFLRHSVPLWSVPGLNAGADNLPPTAKAICLNSLFKGGKRCKDLPQISLFAQNCPESQELSALYNPWERGLRTLSSLPVRNAVAGEGKPASATYLTN
jgi:hypothetical protein